MKKLLGIIIVVGIGVMCYRQYKEHERQQKKVTINKK